ncbi:MAG: transposase [bacterium]
MPEMADILRRYGHAYRAKYGSRMLPSHKRTIGDIIKCRTRDMGGKVYECPEHHELAYKYHSCMNRSCPKCQNDQAQTWLAKERKRLIAVPYFLLTFTLPKELRNMARSHQRLFYKIMFAVAWQAMKKLACDPRLIGGLLGALAVLHTWGRTLIYHPHIHFLVPAGGLNEDLNTWIPAQKNFFLPVKALSKIFRAKMRDSLKAEALELFRQIPNQVWHKDWVVHCKSAGNGQAVLKYFAPYVYRVAISNKRIIKLENDQVTFVSKHPKTKQWKPVTLPVFEFLRRFLQHVLPLGFKKSLS